MKISFYSLRSLKLGLLGENNSELKGR